MASSLNLAPSLLAAPAEVHRPVRALKQGTKGRRCGRNCSLLGVILNPSLTSFLDVLLLQKSMNDLEKAPLVRLRPCVRAESASQGILVKS
jgi:hypothetical protein